MKLDICTIVTPVSRPACLGELSLREEGTEHRAMGHVILEKRKGKLFVDGREAVRFLSTSPVGPWNVRGHELRREMTLRPGLNTCFLDELLCNPGFIPDEWSDGRTYFCATIHCWRYGDFADLCVRYLYRKVDGQWAWSYTPLDYVFGPKAYAAELLTEL